MPTELLSTGLQIANKDELRLAVKDAYQDSYQTAIDFSSNTPDGQVTEIVDVQWKRDFLEVLLSVFNSFDPDQASGRVLDDRCGITNTYRNGGSFAFVNVNITAGRALRLVGLDAQADNPDGVGYTVTDNAGNKFILLDTVNIPVAGVYNLAFRAENLGAISVQPNTITNPQTVVFGVIAINNASGVTLNGTDEESDASLRLRRRLSIANGGTGSSEAIASGLINLTNIKGLKIYDVDSSGVPIDPNNPNPLWGIWVIVDGSVSNNDVANILYTKMSEGTRMWGSITIPVDREYGNPFLATFDRVVGINLYIKFDLKPTATNQTFDTAFITQYLIDNKTFEIGESADTASLTCIVQSGIDTSGTLGVVLNLQISLNGATWLSFLDVPNPINKWVIVADNVTPTVVPMRNSRETSATDIKYPVKKKNGKKL